MNTSNTNNKRKTLVIGDVHGCLEELQELISKTKATDVYCCGDLIDRGRDSYGVVKFCRQNNVKTVLGNHELMFIEAISNYFKNRDKLDLKFSDWWLNGGESVFNSTTEKQLKEMLEYFKTLPVYIVLDHFINDRQVIISHSFILQLIKGFKKQPSGTFLVECVWNRYRPKVKKDYKYFNIHGHSPTDWYAKLNAEPYMTEFQMNLDTGCAYPEIKTRGCLSGYVIEDNAYHRVRNKDLL